MSRRSWPLGCECCRAGHGRKNDDADAVSVGIAALTSPALGTAEIDAATTALRAVVEHRDDLVKTRTQTVNRLHVVLTRLVPAGGRRHLSADHAAELLRGVRPRDAAAKTLRALAMDLVSEVRQLDRRIAKAANDIQMAVSASDTTLTELHGLGALTAGKILGRVGDVSRFRSAAVSSTDQSCRGVSKAKPTDGPRCRRKELWRHACL